MRRTLGSLLVISLLTCSPVFHGAAFSHDVVMWKALKDYTSAKATIVLTEKRNNDSKEILEGEIDFLLAEIDNNSYKLTALLKERRVLADQIDKAMLHRAADKERLTDVQMEAYQSYADITYRKNIDVLACLHRIEDSKKLTNAERELLQPTTDYSVIYNDIEQVRTAQVEAIEKLGDIVAVSGEVLRVL